jgi:uncharacterized protein
MKVVFADTGYWQAVLNPHDHLHLKAIGVSKAQGRVRIVTTEMVLAELLAALSKRSVRALAVTGVDSIRRNPNVEVVPQTSLQFEGAYARYRAHDDKEWSLTDCASFELMASRGLTEALAHDQHFEQAGFVALLR